MEFKRLKKEDAKEELRKLIKDFEDDIKEVDKLSETSIRTSYIDQLFEILGWNIRNTKETILEPQDKEGRLDYLLRLGNIDALIIEAKKTKVNLDIDTNSGISSSKQAIMYAWHKNCKFVILTNFKELKVFHALFKPRNVSKHLVYVQNFGYFNLKYTDFLEKFDLLWLLSNESFLKDELKKYLSKEDIKISKPVDATILDDLFKYRDWLSKDIKDLNPYIAKDSNREEKDIIDEAVQCLIDRLIFIRSTEDRGLEEEDKLLKLVKDFKEMRLKKRLFFELIDIFKTFNGNYNSKLFKESFVDTKLKISDDVLSKVINGLYFGVDNHTEKYNFKNISVDLLGSIYEQYLSVILRTTELRAKLKKSGYRKEMGIYYTPPYIVKYIIENTVGRLVKDKNIDELSQLKILDPACGSGSFLQSAFNFMVDEMKEKIKSGEKSKEFPFFNSELKEDKLWLGQKIQILRNNIFGVDLDEKATEIAQLSLLLKLLEGEGIDTKKRLLPTMADNIKCGNSIIDDLDTHKKAFNWKANFKDIFKDSDNDRFDIVVGNPPWGGKISDKEKKYYISHYSSIKRELETQLLFIERGLELLKEGGYLGFIVPNTWMYLFSTQPIREEILSECRIVYLVELTKYIFADAPDIVPVIIILQKIKSDKSRDENTILTTSFSDKKNIDDNVLVGCHYKKIQQKDISNAQSKIFNLNLTPEVTKLLKKIKEGSQNLSELSKMNYGIKTGNNKKYISKEKKNQNFKKCLKTKEIQRYIVQWKGLWLDYGNYLAGYRKSSLDIPKIIIQYIRKLSLKRRLICGFDESGEYYPLNNYSYITGEIKTLKYLLAIINSELMNFYFSNTFIDYNIKPTYLDMLPIKKATEKQQEQIIKKVDRMLELNEKYVIQKENSREKDMLKQQINQTDYEIDELVYDLYGLKEEKELIKKSS